MPIERVPYERCPICESQGFKVLHEGVPLHMDGHPEIGLPKKVTWLQCIACEHAYSSGYWDDETTRKLWKTRPEPVALDVNLERVQWGRIVEKVLALWSNFPMWEVKQAGDQCDASQVPPGRAPAEYHEGSPARWLDVGCGDGIGITVAEEYGFEAMGIDVRLSPVLQIVKGLGYRVIETDFTSWKGATVELVDECLQKLETLEADVIVMAEFLEHQPFPVGELARAKNLLRPGGVVYASVPSRDSFVWRIKDRRKEQSTWGQMEHFHAFGRKQLEACFRKAGLEPVAFHVGERYYETMEVIGR